MTPRLLCAVLCSFLATTAFAQQAYFDFPKPNLVESVHEDDGTVQFTVTRTGNLSGPVTVEYSALEDTARAGIEYEAPSATLNFADQETQKTVSLTLIDDDESDLVSPRRLTLKLSFPRSGGGFIESFMGIDIFDDEPPPPPLALVFGDLTFSEGDGVTNTYLTVGLNRTMEQSVSVAFRGYDFDIVNGVKVRLGGVTFLPGETSKQAPLTIYGNVGYDGPGPKSFHITGSQGSGPYVANLEFEILLTEDDLQPTVTIADMSVPEGSCAPTPIEITLTTDYPVNGTVYWTTGDGTATDADADYGPYGVAWPIEFRDSTTAKLTVVAPYGDLKVEDDETFVVTLTSATNMTIGDGTATITIENDDEEPPGFAEDFVRIEAGEQSNLTINFPAPAPKGTVKLSSSDPSVEVPATVEVLERATSISFAAKATEAAGEVVITADLPGPLGATRLTATVDAFRDSDLHFENPRRFTYAGETAIASLTIAPPRQEEVTVALTSSAGIVAPESVVVPPGGDVEFPFTSLAAGRSRITATYGENTDSLLIDIAAQQVKSFEPDLGSTSGGTAVTLKGIGFSPGCSASFGSVAAPTKFVDAQTLIATTPAHVAANVNVTVMCGATPVTATGEFRFANSRRRRSRH